MMTEEKIRQRLEEQTGLRGELHAKLRRNNEAREARKQQLLRDGKVQEFENDTVLIDLASVHTEIADRVTRYDVAIGELKGILES